MARSATQTKAIATLMNEFKLLRKKARKYGDAEDVEIVDDLRKFACLLIDRLPDEVATSDG